MAHTGRMGFVQSVVVLSRPRTHSESAPVVRALHRAGRHAPPWPKKHTPFASPPFRVRVVCWFHFAGRSRDYLREWVVVGGADAPAFL